jgi:hypothetical protein
VKLGYFPAESSHCRKGTLDHPRHLEACHP